MLRRSNLFLKMFEPKVDARNERRRHGQVTDAPLPEIIDQLQGVGIVSDSEIGSDLLPFDVSRIDTEQNVGLVFQLSDQSHFYVRIVTGQDTSRMIIIKQFAPKFEVELVIELFNSFENLVRSRMYFSLSNPILSCMNECNPLMLILSAV